MCLFLVPLGSSVPPSPARRLPSSSTRGRGRGRGRARGGFSSGAGGSDLHSRHDGFEDESGDDDADEDDGVFVRVGIEL